MAQTIHLVGFGSQGTAWAKALRQSGWSVKVFLRDKTSATFLRASEMGFSAELVQELPRALATDSNLSLDTVNREPALIAMLCPDDTIGVVYHEVLKSVSTPLVMVLATGYAVYAGALENLREGHQVAMVGPKAIGPKLLSNFETHFPEPHNLVAALATDSQNESLILKLSRALGFSEKNLVRTTFETEAIGDLISEQSLLCGGVFTLLEWTMENMKKAGIPPKLIREECWSELELIAALVREKGPGSTFSMISQAAQCGTVAARRRLEACGVREELEQLTLDIQQKKFIEFARNSDWKKDAQEIKSRLMKWEELLK